MSTRGHPSSGPPSDPEQVAEAIDQLIRVGSLFEVAQRAVAAGPTAEPLEDALQRAAAAGYGEEVEVVALARRNPDLVRGLTVASGSGWIAAIATVVVLAVPAGLFAAVPALAARVLVTEWVLMWSAGSALERLEPDDQRRARLLFDTAIYRTRGRYRLRPVDAVMLTAGGLAFWALFLVLRLRSEASGPVWVALMGAAALMLAAGPPAIAATIRMRALKATPRSEHEEKPPSASDVRLRGVIIGVLAATLLLAGITTVVGTFAGTSVPSRAIALGVALVVDLLLAAALVSAVRSRRRMKEDLVGRAPAPA